MYRCHKPFHRHEHWDKTDIPSAKPQSTGCSYYKPQSDYKPKPAQYSNYKPQYKPYSGKTRRVKSIVLFLFIIALIVLIVYLMNK